ncbi:MAG: hydrogenase maturation protease [Bryobacteraceae bacterium]|nr:hydrogenase maturation protease [Bryobacteraceae bacterium]
MAEGTDAARTLIAALGNPLMGDDGAGAAILEELRRRGAAARARLHDAGAAGGDLLLELEGVETLVLLDAGCSEDMPGTVCVLQDEEILQYAEQRGMGSHQPSLADTLRLAGRLSLKPRRILVVGIAARQFGLGAGLSPEVQAAVAEAADAVARRLGWEADSAGAPDTLVPGAE